MPPATGAYRGRGGGNGSRTMLLTRVQAARAGKPAVMDMLTPATDDPRRLRPDTPARRALRVIVVAVALLAFAACGSDGSSEQATTPPGVEGEASDDGTQRFPDVVEAEVTAAGEGQFSVAATVSSPYDSPDRYADAFRVLDPEGNELGVRELTHDHANEQPFTREVTVSIPGGVDEVTVEGRDQANGYGGDTATAMVPHEGA